MSRIAGLISSQPHELQPFDQCLECFPGSARRSVITSGARFGWSGFNFSTGGVTEIGPLIISIDGRILNYDSLQLSYSSQSPFEMIAILYRKYGFIDLLTMLDGDFAISLYDSHANILWLGRDRFGVKPLYYYYSDEFICFASQPRFLTQFKRIPSNINKNFVARFLGTHYRSFDNLPEESPYEYINQLPAAHAVRFDNRSSNSLYRYWDLHDLPDWSDTEDVLAEQYSSLLFSSVKKRVASVPNPAFTLSGGLDSSSVLCASSVLLDKKLDAYSSVYVDPTFDERHEIMDVVEQRVSNWHPIEISDSIDIFDIAKKMVAVHDEPVATATWLSHFLLCSEVSSNGHSALFGGLGGDELNAGEYEYFPMYFADLQYSSQNELLEKEIEYWASYHDHPIHKKSSSVAFDLINRLTNARNPGVVLPDLDRQLKYSNSVLNEFYDLSSFSPVMDTPFNSYLKNRAYQDMFRETLPCCLRAEDRQCTNAGIEHFDPFLDHHLVEFMFRVPGHSKIRSGVTKQLLRQAMSGTLPEQTRQRIKKTGWNAPAHRWFGKSALSSLRDLIDSEYIRNYDIININYVLDIIADHERIISSESIQDNHMMFLWQLLNLTTWLYSFK